MHVDVCIRGIGADICSAISFCAASLRRSEVDVDLLCVAFLGAAITSFGGSAFSADQLGAGGGAITCGRGCGT